MSVLALATTSADLDLLRARLVLVGHKLAADVTGACTSATVERTIDGASTLTLAVPDHRRTLLRSGVLDDYLWAEVDGYRYQLVKPDKGTDVLTLTFEDSISAALRQHKSTRSWAAGSTTRTAIVRDMATEAGVAVAVDPDLNATVSSEVNRSKVNPGETTPSQVTDSWSLTGSLASDVNVRRFSDGQRLVFGSDAWLASRYPQVALREPIVTPGQALAPTAVVNIDFSIDYGQASSSATLTVDADRWAVPVGQAVTLTGMGPAEGLWLVQRATRTLTRNRMSVELTRQTKALPEPSDGGDFSFLPGATTVQGSSGPSNLRDGDLTSTQLATAGSPRARLVAYARAQSGKPYVWGASGPNSFDCSGLVQQAAAAAGKPLAKPANAQWNAVRTRGVTLSIPDALKTEGALLFRVGLPEPNGDHVVISLGDGTTVEARGRAYGCGVFPGAAGRTWTNAGLWT